MGKVQFVLNGKETFVGGPGPKALKVISFIKSIPKGKFFDIEGIAQCVDLTPLSIKVVQRDHRDAYADRILIIRARHGSGNRLIFGHPDSIKQLRKQMQAEGLL